MPACERNLIATVAAPADDSALARWTRPRRAFIAFALIFGTALVMIIPPFQSADEPLHFLRAYQITDGVFVSRQMDSRGFAAGDFPASLYKIWLPFSHIGFHPEVKTSFSAIRDGLRIPLSENERMPITIPATAHYSPACYLPQCLGILIGRAFGTGPLAMLYLGRAANLLVWILLGYLTLRSAPAISRPMFLLLLMPMTLFVTATCSADVPTDAITLVFTATVCRFAAFSEADSVGVRRLVILLFLCMGMCLCKFAYAPLLALLLLIPARNFGGGMRYGVKLASLILPSAIVSVVWILVSSNIDTRISLSSNVSASAQFQWLVHHPFGFAPLFMETFRLRGWTFAQSYFGVIGWLDMYLPNPLIIGYLILLGLACLFSGDKSALPPPGRTAVIVMPAVICSFLIISLLSYLYWTPVGADFIDGIHGRYLIPLSPAVFLLICSATRRLRNPCPRIAVDLGMILISLCVCVYFVAMVWNRYYG